MLDFPAQSFIRFFDPHGLLQLSNRPQWLTVRGGSRRYVERMAADIGEVLPTVGDTDASAHLMSLPLRDAREVFERQYLLAQIERFGGNISKTAEFVGMERSALHRKIKSLGL